MPEEKGPIINRSKIQLATSYAPGTLFTFDGGKGCFLSVPIMTRHYSSSISVVVQRQIEEQMKELITNWFNNGMSCRGNSGPPVYEQQVLDDAFLDYRRQPSLDMSHFVLLEPVQVGYCPEPLTFSCRRCGLLHNYRGVDDFVRNYPNQQRRVDCRESSNGQHDWLQLDVVFAHWSGNYESLYPESPCTCGNDEFFLKKSNTGVFSDWYFKCTRDGCPERKELTRRDPKTRELLEDKIRQGSAHQRKEMNMLPVSYRASSLYYVQTDRFIPYPDTSIFELLHPGRTRELAEELLSLYNYSRQPLTDDQIKLSLKQCGQEGAFRAYEGMKTLREQMTKSGSRDSAETIQVQIENMLSEWERQGWLSRETEIPDILKAKTTERSSYARRYDPVRLGIEHALLEKRHINAVGDTQISAVDLLTPPPDIAPEGMEMAERKQAYQTTLRLALQRLGVKRFFLLRELDLVQYSFGFTRVSSTPTTEQKNLTMPVRLCAFDHVERGRRPIYVMHQKNEAFYVQLDPAIVVKWLTINGITEDLTFPDGLKFGARYIESYHDFGPYLDDFKRRDRSTRRSICNFTYLLLHTIAHQFVNCISEYSGLEYGSFGEYIFPPDLAFLIYRSGMTPDLGNLSSMWRNFSIGVLEQMLSANKLLCSSGSLCDQRGGACPGCIMLPETTCIAGNQLLSRAVLRGGPAPLWSTDASNIIGFFKMTTEDLREDR